MFYDKVSSCLFGCDFNGFLVKEEYPGCQVGYLRVAMFMTGIYVI
jgi:hypothetical protein